MPRYFFDTDDGRSFVLDEVGVEFASPETAFKAASVALGEMARDLPCKTAQQVMNITVRDEADNKLWTCTMRCDCGPA